MKIGILGGTFDPVHQHHLIIAKAAKIKLNLDEFFLLPAKQNPLKSHSSSSSKDRLKMLELAILEQDWIKIEKYELESDNPYSYSIDTIKFLHQKYPQAQFYFLIGADNLKTLPQWKEIEILKTLVQFVVVNRPHFPKLKILMHQYNCIDLRVTSSAASSTKIRLGKDLSFVAPNVLQYINNNFLYIHERLKFNLDQERYEHCLFVAQAAQELALKFKVNQTLAFVAGAYHDICKQWSLSKLKKYLMIHFPLGLQTPHAIWHSYVGAFYVKNDLQYDNLELFDAIFYHTTAKSHMSALSKIVFLADKISQERNFLGIEKLRELAFINLDKAIGYYLQLLKAKLIKDKQMLSQDFQDIYEFYNKA